jgi:hypothetical protein
MWRTGEDDQRGGGEWEPIKIPQGNLTYVLKSIRHPSLLTRSRPHSYSKSIGPRNTCETVNKNRIKNQFMSSQTFDRTTCGRVWETNVWEQLKLGNLEFFDPISQKQERNEFLQQSTQEPDRKNQDLNWHKNSQRRKLLEGLLLAANAWAGRIQRPPALCHCEWNSCVKNVCGQLYRWAENKMEHSWSCADREMKAGRSCAPERHRRTRGWENQRAEQIDWEEPAESWSNWGSTGKLHAEERIWDGALNWDQAAVDRTKKTPEMVRQILAACKEWMRPVQARHVNTRFQAKRWKPAGGALALSKKMKVHTGRKNSNDTKALLSRTGTDKKNPLLEQIEPRKSQSLGWKRRHLLTETETKRD